MKQISDHAFKRKAAILLLVIGILVTLLGLLLLAQSYLIPRKGVGLGDISGDILVQVPVDEVREDTLYISNGRREYDGSMQLLIPAIGVDTSVAASTAPEVLQKSPGLYEFAQMPGEEGGNASIAGHRDIFDQAFYDLDKIQAGDYIYLLYGDNVYRYLYHSTKVVGPYDWSVIARQGYTAVTLTTCDPIGTARNRLIVHGELNHVYHFQPDLEFVENQEAYYSEHKNE